MFATIVSFVFGFQFVISLLLFIKNAKSIRKIPLYVDVQGRMSRTLRLMPIMIAALIGIAAACMTEYHVTSMLVAMILLPVLHSHWKVSPLAVRSVTDIEDMRNESFRKVISKGARSRILTIGICVNLFLTYYTLFN